MFWNELHDILGESVNVMMINDYSMKPLSAADFVLQIFPLKTFDINWSGLLS